MNRKIDLDLFETFGLGEPPSVKATSEDFLANTQDRPESTSRAPSAAEHQIDPLLTVSPSADDASIDLMTRERGSLIAQGISTDAESDLESQGTPSVRSGSLGRMLAGCALLVVVAYLLWPSSEPSQRASLRAVDAVSTPSAPAVSEASTQQTATAAPSAPLVQAAPSRTVAIDLAAMQPSPQSAADVAAEIEIDRIVLPVEEQNCSSRFVQRDSRQVCMTQGATRYFKCTRGGGRIWDAALPGCEIL